MKHSSYVRFRPRDQQQPGLLQQGAASASTAAGATACGHGHDRRLQLLDYAAASGASGPRQELAALKRRRDRDRRPERILADLQAELDEERSGKASMREIVRERGTRAGSRQEVGAPLGRGCSLR